MQTVNELAQAAMRLIEAGMSLKHAVNLTAGAYCIDPELIYKQIAKLQNKSK